jgi:predicted CXXCH cytochrome family protein
MYKLVYGLLSIAFLVLVLLDGKVSISQETETNDQCYNCHKELDGKLKRPADLYKSDVHFRNNVKCSGCHGGNPNSEDSDESMSKAAGFIGIPRGGNVARICAKCHKDEFQDLSKSVHGKSSTGKGKIINNCLTCHGVHNILSVKNPSSKVRGRNIVNTCGGCHSNASYIDKYNPNLSIDQLEKYKTSVHGQRIFEGDKRAATCASCHGNHNIRKATDPISRVFISNLPSMCNGCHGDEKYMKPYNIPTNQYEEFKSSVHGVALFKKGDLNAPTCNTCHGNHAAAPPEVESISKVCGICHVLTAEMFQESPHKKVFKEEDIHECGACHSNHNIIDPTDEMLGVGEKSVCVKCHKSDDEGYKVAQEMSLLIDSLSKDVDLARYFMNEAEQKGMDVSDAEFDQNDIKQVLITTRTISHYCNIDKFLESINVGFKLTNTAKMSGEEAIDEYYFRRWGLGVSTIFITILILALYFKIKKIEKKNKAIK